VCSRTSRRTAALATVLLSALTGARVSAQQTSVSISMQAAPAVPRVGGAQVIGIRTGTPVLHTFAVTGTRPMTFSVTGLPAGLTLDATNGRLAGMVANAGTSTVMVTASNGLGSDTRALRIVVGDTIALTPPMGWNSYDSFDDSVTEAEMIAQATWLRDHLLPYGWDTAVVDFRWYDPNAQASDQNQAAINTTLVTDANGRMQPATNRFPSAVGGVGFKPLADMIHGMGLKFGIHIMRGIPRKSVQANTPIAGSTFTAQNAAVTTSIAAWNSDMYGVTGAAGQAWYNSIFQQYAAWGVDFVKVDDSSAPTYHMEEVGFIHNAIGSSGRSMVLSLSPGATPTSAAADLRVNASMWRMYNDFWDNWSALGDPANAQGAFALAQTWSTTNTAAAGHWPDADMLPLGHLGPRCPVGGANRNTNFTANEQVAMMTLWALLPSPLMLGANLTLTTDAFFAALVTNDEVIAVGQDDLGAKARLVVRTGATEVWSKDLSGGRKAVGLFNRGATDATVATTWTALGLSGPLSVRNLWTRTDLGSMASGASLLVPWHAAALLLVGPAAPPVSDGGAGGTDAAVTTPDAGPTNADAGGGGVGVDASSSGGAGQVGTGGAGGGAAPGGGGGGGAGNIGPTAGAGGATGSAGGGGQTPSSGGCGCSFGASDHGAWSWLVVIFVALSALIRRRRARLG
jgi:MYXO-CTERM domain-containing protein